MTMNKIAVLGVGRVGAAVARTALRAGYDVEVAGSGPAEDIELIAEIVIPGATARTAAEAVRDADIVVVAVPLHKHRTVDPAILDGKIVVDAMNYWREVDGTIPDFERDLSSSEVVARHFRGARLVKTLNHIGYRDLEDHARPAGAPGRRALAVASDDDAAAAAVLEVIDRFGFDGVHSGPLDSGAAFQTGTAIFNGSFTASELERELGLDARTEAA
ncbi:NAD(P)-binding domain-containing protein [Tessaracoccus sp. OS52]|uniref:NADPH-dependent F420 reductase n=1 Tax=Tessaracoccus sp. OS52 TaxID=2886691 RepID=UPI001D11E74C|nr:NAD(P)-binding domain-containing protein [Tessaracoccus sp. OS52]